MQACLGKAKGRDSLSLIEGTLNLASFDYVIVVRYVEI